MKPLYQVYQNTPNSSLLILATFDLSEALECRRFELYHASIATSTLVTGVTIRTERRGPRPSMACRVAK